PRPRPKESESGRAWRPAPDSSLLALLGVLRLVAALCLEFAGALGERRLRLRGPVGRNHHTARAERADVLGERRHRRALDLGGNALRFGESGVQLRLFTLPDRGDLHPVFVLLGHDRSFLELRARRRAPSLRVRPRAPPPRRGARRAPDRPPRKPRPPP